MSGIQLSFECDWFDQVTGLLSKMYIKFHLENSTVEILTDVKIFMSRIFVANITQAEVIVKTQHSGRWQASMQK
jgi:hypothetical protein